MAKKIPSYLIPGAEAYYQPEHADERPQEVSQQSLSDAFGSVLHDIRTEQNLTQQEVADRAGITRGLFGKLEGSHGMPNMDTVGRVAEGLGVSVELLMMRTAAESAGADPEITDRALDALQGLSETTNLSAQGFQQAYAEVLESQREEHDISVRSLVENVDSCAHSYQTILEPVETARLGTYFNLAGGLQDEGVSPAQIIAMSSAESVGVSYPEVPEGSQERRVFDLVEDIRKRTSRNF